MGGGTALAGLAADMVYTSALTAFLSLGFFLMLKYCRIFLMSYGQIVVLGGYVSTFMQVGPLRLLLAVVVAGAAGGLVGALNYGLLLSSLQRKDYSSPLLLTWGSALILMELYRIGFGAAGRFAPVVDAGTLDFLGTTFPATRAISAMIAIAFIAVTLILLNLPANRIRLFAVSDDQQVASELGVSLPTVLMTLFTLACALAAVAGVLLAQDSAVTPYAGIDVTIQAALAGLVAGKRLGPGLLLAALLGAVRTGLGYWIGLTGAWLAVLAGVAVLAAFRNASVIRYGDQ